MTSISVIIPTFNRYHTLPRAILSVQQQTVKTDEIIVIDDGSNDATPAMLKQRFPEIKRLRQENAGVSSARNLGIRHAKSDWIALLDSDDEWLPSKLEYQLNALAAHESIRLIHCDEIWIRNGTRVNAMHKHRKYGGWIYPQCLPLCAISPSAALIRRDVFADIGYFDENLPACEDYDFWLRFCAHEPVAYVDKPLLNKFGGHADQLSARYWGMDRFRLQALAKAIESRRLSSDYLKLTQAQLEKKLAILINGARKRNNTTWAIELEQTYQHLLGPDNTDLNL